jgi:hypothetical protein
VKLPRSAFLWRYWRSSRLMLLCQHGGLILGDLMLPGRLVDVHRSVDHVNEVALEYAPGAAGALRGLVAFRQFSGCWVEAFLHDSGRLDDAVEAAVSSAVKAVTFVVGGVDRYRSTAGVAGEFSRA